MKSVFKIITLVQAALAIIWIVFKGSFLIPSFSDGSMLRACSDMKFDEYTGLVYPVFLRLIMSVSSGLPGMIIIYIIQYLAIIFAACYLLKALEKFSPEGLVYIITFPLVIQVATSISVHVFEVALFLIFLGIIFDSKAVNKEIFLGAVIVISGLVSVSFGSVLGIIWLVYAIYQIRNKNFNHIVTLCASTAVAGIIFLLTVTPGVYGKMPGTPGTALMCNMAAAHLEEDYYFWPDYVKEAVPFEGLSEVVKSREYAVTLLGDTVYQKLGYKEAVKASWDIAFASIKNRSKETVFTVLSGYKDYLFMPVTMLKNTRGTGQSVTAYNLEGFRGSVPSFSRLYIFVSFIMFFIYVITACISVLGENKSHKSFKCALAGLGIWIMLSALYSIFSIQYFDYFKMLPAFSFLMTAAVPVIKIKEEEIIEEN